MAKNNEGYTHLPHCCHPLAQHIKSFDPKAVVVVQLLLVDGVGQQPWPAKNSTFVDSGHCCTLEH